MSMAGIKGLFRDTESWTPYSGELHHNYPLTTLIVPEDKPEQRPASRLPLTRAARTPRRSS